MTKRILSILAIMSIATMMILSSCTAAGVECGLIGKWKSENDSDSNDTYEITSDDKFISEHSSTKIEFTIKSVSNNTIKVEYKGVESEMEYTELACDSVKFNDENYKRVY